MTLALAADRTETIGIGPGVLVPSNRHVLTTATAIAHLESLAAGRTAYAFGTGFTARHALGQRPLKWAEVADYIRTLRALLRGETVEIDGAMVAMLHGAGQAPPRPIEPPFLVGASGPKGEAVAREVGDGVIGASPIAGFSWSVWLAFGTVIDDGRRTRGRARPAIGGARRGDRLSRGVSAPATDVRRPPWFGRVAGVGRGGRSVGASPRGPSWSSHRAQSTRPHGDDRTDRGGREPERDGVALA